MNGMWRKALLTLLACLALALCGCAGLRSPGGPASADTETRQDGVKEVKLTMYLLGEAPQGLPDVLAELNRKLEADIHATLDVRYIGWGDLQSKYPLVLASGENVDLIYAANWNSYVQEATKGAFLPLSPELLQANMPRHMAKLNPAALEAAKVGGKIYMVPTSTPDRKVNVALIRTDIRERAGLAPIRRFADIEPYLAAVKRLYPDMIPLNLDNKYDLPTPFLNLMLSKVAYTGAPLDSGDPNLQGIAYDYEDSSGRLYSTVEDGPIASAQKYAASVMKIWYDKGYINKNPYANKVRSKDGFCEGKSAVAFGNSYDINSVVTACQAKGIGTEVIPIVDTAGHYPQANWLNNGVAVAAGSKNAERALQALDRIMEDPAYVDLAYYGIEGKHYIKKGDDLIDLPPGVTPETDTYPPDAAGLWFVNKDYFRPFASWPQAYIDHIQRVKQYLIPTVYNNFSFNSDPVKTEEASIANVSIQYAFPLYIGAVGNVDEAFALLQSKLKAAGIDKVKAEVEKQAAAYLQRTRQGQQ